MAMRQNAKVNNRSFEIVFIGGSFGLTGTVPWTIIVHHGKKKIIASPSEVSAGCYDSLFTWRYRGRIA